MGIKKLFNNYKTNLFSIVLVVVVFFAGWVINSIDSKNKDMEKCVEEYKKESAEKYNAEYEFYKTKEIEIKNKQEEVMRKQMRIELESAGKIIQEEMEENYGFSDKDKFIEKIRNVSFKETSTRRTYNQDGNWFILITVGGYTYFLINDISECGEPKIDNKTILNIPGRTKSIFDEVVWQEEAKYILSCYGLIYAPEYMDGFYPKKLNIMKKYSIDEKLKNTEVFRNIDLVYINSKYPEVYEKMLKMKVITHANPEVAENFMDFVSYNRSTTQEDKLYWGTGLNDREILEVYVVPAGMYGFDKVSRTSGSGVFNDNYIKISIVSCSQFDKFYEKEFYNGYSSLFKILEKSNEDRVLSFKDKIEKETKVSIKHNIFVMTMIFIMVVFCVFLSAYSFHRVPDDLVKKKCDNCPSK